MVRSDDGRDVPVVQAFAFGKYLGYLKVTFDDAGNVVQAKGNPILMDSSIPQGNWPNWFPFYKAVERTHLSGAFILRSACLATMRGAQHAKIRSRFVQFWF